jgi:hypothetical protein
MIFFFVSVFVSLAFQFSFEMNDSNVCVFLFFFFNLKCRFGPIYHSRCANPGADDFNFVICFVFGVLIFVDSG